MYLGHGAYGVEAASRLYFNKSNKELDARRSGADRRHVPAARAPEPVRRHEARDRAGATSCCSGWPTSATSRRPRPTPPSRSRSSRAASRRSRRASRRSSSRRSASTSSSEYGAKVLYESGLLGDDDARRQAAGVGEPGARARPAARSTSATASASRSATSSPRGRRSTASRTSAGRGRSRPATSSRRWSVDRPPRPARRRLRIGALPRRPRRATGYRLDAPHHRPRICSSRAI